MRVRSADGYTLIELLVILAILATIASLAIPVAGNLVEGTKLQSDGRALVVALRGVRQRAIEAQQRVAISEGTNSELITDAGDTISLPGGSNVKLMCDRGRIYFFADGTSDGGTLRLSRGNRFLDIRISWLLGDIVVEGED